VTVDGTISDAAALRADSDAFRANLERLWELEDRKRQLAPTDPEFVALAVDVERLAEALLEDARAQKSAGTDAHVDGLTTPIEQVPADLSALQILDRWRASERALVALTPGSKEARAEEARSEAYRRAYQALFGRRITEPRNGPTGNS
jgi:hypothetical protein